MADAEERFLKSRKQREDARANRAKDESVIDLQKAKEDFNTEVKQLDSKISALLLEGKTEEADDVCRELQHTITSANDTLSIPSHEQRSLNALLSSAQARITDCKNTQKPAKKFGFSSKAKLVSTLPTTSSDVTSNTDAPTVGASKEESTSGEVYADLVNQDIFVPTAKAIFIRRCVNCVVYALPTDGSLFISDSSGCTVYCAPHQLRIKSCTNMSLYTWCTSRPVIESCDAMRFAGYDAWVGLLDSPSNSLKTHSEWVTSVGHFKDLEWAQKSFTQVDDFHWLKQSQSPHWSLIPPDQWQISKVRFVAPNAGN